MVQNIDKGFKMITPPPKKKNTYIHTYMHTYNLDLATMAISKLTSLWGDVLNKERKFR